MYNDEAFQFILRNSGTTSRQIRETLGLTSPSLDKRLLRLVKHGVVTRVSRPSIYGIQAYHYYPTDVGLQYKRV